MIYCFFHFIAFLCTGEGRDRELKEGLHENVCVNFVKRVSPHNASFCLIQSRIVHSSLAYCALLRTVYCVLCNTDRFTNFITVKYVTI